MAVQRFEIDVDPNFEIHTSYHNDFFLLRTRVLVDGENTEIRSVREGKYEGPVLNFYHSGSTVSTKLRLIASTVSPILVQYGVYHVDTFYCEQSPLFHIVFSSESCLNNFILAMGEVKSALEQKLQSLFSSIPESAQQLTVKVQPDLFLVSPNRQETKGAEVHLVTAENCSYILARWKDSKLFDFGALYQEEVKPPQVTSQPTSQSDILPGKTVAFSVQATGTELNYQWQWKQFGRESEKDGWQNLTSQGGTFQEIGTELRLTGVKASNAGYYRCVVSNSAGSETSQCASLTVAAELADLVSELQEVNDWVTLGLYLEIKIWRLRAIEKERLTIEERRTQMLEEWQKKVTPTWSALVQALVGIGMRRLAYELARKHGVPPPKLSDDEFKPLEQVTNTPQQEEVTESKLLTEIEKRRKDLEQKYRKLADSEEQLRHSQKSRSAVNEKVSQVMSRIEELHKKVRKIVQEKKILEIELQSKQKECQLLSEIRAKDAVHSEKDAVISTMLEEKISQKQKEIEILIKELHKKNTDLQSAQQEAKMKQEELLKVRTELKKKHKVVKELKEKNEKLSCSYNVRKEQVSKLIQLIVALSSDESETKQRLLDIKQESDSKSRQIEACEQNISRLSEEVEGLSHCLQEKEATMAQLQSKLQSHEQLATTPETLSELLKLAPQIAELEFRLQEAEYQKLQAELEREAAIEEVEAMQNFVTLLHVQLDEPPKITVHPKSLKEIWPGKPVVFTVQATGTDPLSYHWQWKPAAEEGEWQPCRAEWSDGATLAIPSVQKSSEGSYRCVISNYAGTQTSNPAELIIADPPRVTTQSQDLKDAVPGNAVMFTVEATGTEPLRYRWEWNPAGEGNEWQPCGYEGVSGANSSTVTISSVQKANVGSYRCVISNCAGSQTSQPAQLSVADPPRVITHPQELENIVASQPAMFSIEASGNEPLRYKWEWKPAESEKWQLCDAQGSNSTTLTILSVQNYAGEQTSDAANLIVAKPPSIITDPQDLIAAQERSAKFTIRAIGTEPLSYKWQWKPAKKWWMWGGSEEWKPCDANGSDGATLTIPSVQKSSEGSYRCVISNCAGNETSKPAKLKLSLQLRWRRCRDMEYGMTDYPRCVVLERRVYVGGGSTGYVDYIVFKYDPDTDKWSRLPRYQYKYFAISIINSRLTLVGGCNNLKVTNQLAVYEPLSQHWTYPYHPMPTPRYDTAVVMYDKWLLVAGGRGAGLGHDLATVELLNTSTNQWLAVSSLPTPCRFMTSATINNFGYFVTASKQVYRVSLPDIVSQTVDQSTASKSPALWCRLPDTPLERSAAISLRGYLIAVGGNHDNRTRTDIYLYQPESEQWTKVGDLPNAREYCSCVVLPSGELLVAGGQEKYYVRTTRVDVASVLN